MLFSFLVIYFFSFPSDKIPNKFSSITLSFKIEKLYLKTLFSKEKIASQKIGAVSVSSESVKLKYGNIAPDGLFAEFRIPPFMTSRACSKVLFPEAFGPYIKEVLKRFSSLFSNV